MTTTAPHDDLAAVPGHGTAGARARIAYQPALDGIRGIGLFFVMASHAGFEWARGGFFWVSSFFTLSGYLITTLLISEHRNHGTISAKVFWARRFRRLLPAAVVTLLGVCVFAVTVADASQLERLRGDGLAALFYVANWRFVVTDTSYADLFASPSPVQHFWTLSIEEQYYAFFPLLIIGALAIGRGRWSRVAAVVGGLTALSIAWMLWLHHDGAGIDRLYFGTDTRLPELTAGVLLAIALDRWQPSAGTESPTTNRALVAGGTLATVAIVALTFTVERTDAWLYQGGLALYAVVSCAMISAALQPTGPVRRALSLGVLRQLGMLSYSAYLLHWPVFLVIDEDRTGLDPWPLFALRIAVTVAGSVVVTRLVEQPIRSGHLLRGRLGVVAVPLSFAVVVAGLVVVTADPPETVDADFAAAEDPNPAPSATPGAVRVMVVGDSQAWVVGEGMRRWAETNPTRAAVWNVAVPGCGLVRGGQSDFLGEVREGVCDDWAPRWEVQLAEFDPDVVVVLSGQWDWVDRKLPEWDRWRSYGDEVFDRHVVAEYLAVADALTATGARVVWLTNPCYELEGFGDDPRYANATYLPPVVEAFPEQVAVYDLFADLCPGGDYTEALGGLEQVRAEDGMHLNEPGADWVAGYLLPELLELAGT